MKEQISEKYNIMFDQLMNQARAKLDSHPLVVTTNEPTMQYWQELKKARQRVK